MITVLCRNKNDYTLSDVLGINSCLQLPLFNNTLIDFQLKVLPCVGNVYCLSETQFESKSEIEVIDLKRLFKLMYEVPFDEEIVLLYTNLFIENVLDNQTVTLLNNSESVFYFAENREQILLASFTAQELRRRLFFIKNTIDILELLYTENDKTTVVSSYFKFIEKYEDYQSIVNDVLNKKTSYLPPHIAEGIYAEGKIPQGDYSVIPPVYIQDNVQIERGAAIGPNATIMSNSLIASNTVIKNSIIMNDSYISSNCFIDGCICCKGASVKRGAVVLKNTVLGENSIIGEDSVIENGTVIKPSVKCDKYLKSPFGKYNDETFTQLSPDKATLLGYVLGCMSEGMKVGVAFDGDAYSQGIKFALLGGLISAKAVCCDFGSTYLSQLFFYSKYCGTDYSIFISNHSGVIDIKIYDESCKPLPIYKYYNMLRFDLSVQPNGTHNYVRQIYGLRKIYIRRIETLFKNFLNIKVNLDTSNNYIFKIFNSITHRIRGERVFADEIDVFINPNGTSASITSKDKRYTHNDLLRIIEFNKSSVNTENTTVSDDLWKVDAVMLVFEVLALVVNQATTIQRLYKNLPGFYYFEKEIDCKLPFGGIANRLNERYALNFEGKSFVFNDEKGSVQIKKSDNSHKLKIKTRSLNAEYALELTGEIEKMLSE